jgi:hypothetical protein
MRNGRSMSEVLIDVFRFGVAEIHAPRLRHSVISANAAQSSTH